MKKGHFVILGFVMFIFTGCGSNRNDLTLNSSSANANSNDRTLFSSSNSAVRSDDSTSETATKSEATMKLEANYDDAQIEYARVVANLGVENKMGYTLERVKNNKIMFSTSTSDAHTSIRVQEIGTEDRFIYYLPLGEGVIEHFGMRKYPSNPTTLPAETYLKIDYDDIALQLLENQEDVSYKDLNIDAINNGDFTSLIGTWRNGKNDFLIINMDGTTNKEFAVHGVSESDKKSKIPYASLSTGGPGGAALGLYKIGFKNPEGDSSDSTKPRLTISQQGGNYSSDAYYYRE